MEKIKIGKPYDLNSSESYVVIGDTLLAGLTDDDKDYLVVAIFNGSKWYVRSKEAVNWEMEYKLKRIWQITSERLALTNAT